MPGRLLPITRAAVAVLIVLALANGVFLFFWPAQAEEHYAWPIAPPISAAFLGAGFLAGTVPTLLVVFVAERWRSLRTLPPALFALASTLFVATLLHAGKFRWDYAPTWGWAVVYGVVPVGIVVLWRLQERNAEPEPPADPGLRPLRSISAATGAALLAAAALMFAFPADSAEFWPWDITQLMGRAVAPWYALVAVTLIACGRSLRTRDEALIPYATILAWSVLVLLVALLHPDDVVREGAELVAWIVVMALLVLVSLYALALSAAASRRSR